jgi:hypothetical protein
MDTRTDKRMKRGSQALTDIRHGAHITDDKSPPALKLAAKREDGRRGAGFISPACITAWYSDLTQTCSTERRF